MNSAPKTLYHRLKSKCYLFDSENQNFRTLQTGGYASEELVNDFESAYEDDDALVQDSVNTRLISRSKLLFDPYPNNNQKTIVNFKLPDFNKNHSQEEMGALVATNLSKLIRSQLRQYLEHRITGNCLSIFNSNGTIRKCQKPKILQEMHLKSVDYSKYIAIVDMGLL